MLLVAKAKRYKNSSSSEFDGGYLLKLVLYLVVGSQWIFFENASGTNRIPIPIGMIIGLVFAMHDHFKIDRKIEYAVLLISMLVGFWAQIGVFINY